MKASSLLLLFCLLVLFCMLGDAGDEVNTMLIDTSSSNINVDRPRVVISLTTSPKRIAKMESTLQSIFRQTIPPDLIQINIPYLFKRTNQSYPVLETLPFLDHPLIRVYRSEDYGPATKLLPTLITEKHPETIIIVVDDDTNYPQDMIARMVDGMIKDPLYIQVGHCGDPLLANSEADFEHSYGYPFGRPSIFRKELCCCQMFEGFGGVAYKRKFFNNQTHSFNEYLKIALADSRCFRSDDLVISNYLTMVGYKGLYLNMRVWQQKHGFDEDALHKLEPTGHPYPLCMQYLRSKLVASTIRLKQEPPPEIPPLQLEEGSLVRASNSRQVYLFVNNSKHPVPDMQTFVSHGWDLDQVLTINPAAIDALALGDAVQNLSPDHHHFIHD